MHDIHLTGQLVCKTADEAAVVVEHLAQHVKMTRAESGLRWQILVDALRRAAVAAEVVGATTKRLP
jgi:heme oxygenase